MKEFGHDYYTFLVSIHSAASEKPPGPGHSHPGTGTHPEGPEVPITVAPCTLVLYTTAKSPGPAMTAEGGSAHCCDPPHTAEIRVQGGWFISDKLEDQGWARLAARPDCSLPPSLPQGPLF